VVKRLQAGNTTHKVSFGRSGASKLQTATKATTPPHSTAAPNQKKQTSMAEPQQNRTQDTNQTDEVDLERRKL